MDTKNQDKYRGMMLDGRYELVELIGSGGMAVVYKAMCHRLNRYVAVKIMRPELAKNEKFRRRFQTESQAIAKLSHPNIVGVYDVSRTDHVEYIVMELVDGITLKQYLQDHGPLDAVQAVDFSLQIALALAHAHGKGIVHRDIKPQNILVVNDGVIKVADFGIANLQSGGAGCGERSHRLGALYLAGAGQGPSGGRTERYLFAWHRHVRNALRKAAV